jgi:uncharacterized cupredoxin-like copper-binding protein
MANQSVQDRPTDDAPAAAEGDSPILFGAGQGAWLSLVTLIAVLALILAFVALVRTNTKSSGSGGAASAGSTLTVVSKEFSFTPAKPVVTAKTAVDVTLDNKGSLEHEFVVLKSGVTISKEADFSEDKVLFRIPKVAAGKTATDTVTLDAGQYQIICTIAGHFTGGMKGTLTAQ